VSIVVAIVTTSNNGISYTDNLRSTVNEQSFTIDTTKPIIPKQDLRLPTLEPRKLTTQQLEVCVLSVGYMFNVNGEKIQVISFKDIPKGVYYIRVGRFIYEYHN